MVVAPEAVPGHDPALDGSPVSHGFPVVVEVDGPCSPRAVGLPEVRSASGQEAAAVPDLEGTSKPTATECLWVANDVQARH